MDACRLGSLEHILKCPLNPEPRDILRDSPGEQFHGLGQIADRRAQPVGIEMPNFRAIESDDTGACRPYPHECADEGRFSAPRHPQNTHGLSRFEPEGNPRNQHRLIR